MHPKDDLRLLESSLLKAALEASGDDASPEKIGEAYQYFFKEVEDKCRSSFLSDIATKSPKILSDHREDYAAFKTRNFQTWKRSFDHLELMCSIARELGEGHGKSIQESNPEANNSVMAALAQIFPRALLVLEEILCLLKGGFPDGALARWRSLYELSVTAKYISTYGEDIANLYLLSFHFLSQNAAQQINHYSEKAALDRFSDDEIRVLNERCRLAEQFIGRDLGTKPRDREWPRINKHHRSFAALEEAVEMDHWRPRYKWATTYTHANYRPMEGLLGSTGRSEDGYLVGPSNIGYVDPFQMSAIILAQITTTYLSHGINADRLIHIRVMHDLSEQMKTISVEDGKAINSGSMPPSK